MNFWFDHVVLCNSLSLLAALVAAYLACRASRKAVRIVCALAAWVCLWPALLVYAAFHPELIDPRFNTYKKFYGDLHAGMTRQEVFAALEHRYPASGARLRPILWSDHQDDLCFFMNPEPPKREPNCEGIFLTLREGRVVKKDYGAD